MTLRPPCPCAHTTNTEPSGSTATRFCVASALAAEMVRVGPNRAAPGAFTRTCTRRFHAAMLFHATAVRPSAPMATRGSSWSTPRCESVMGPVKPPRGPRLRARICHVAPSHPSQT